MYWEWSQPIFKPNTMFISTNIVKYNKLVTMEAQTFFDSNALACFMYKELVWKYKLAIMEKNTPMPVKMVINGRNLSLRPITYDTKWLDVTISSHTNEVIFNVISSPRSLVIIGFSWLVHYNPRVDWHTKSLHLETPKHEDLLIGGESPYSSLHWSNQTWIWDHIPRLVESQNWIDCLNTIGSNYGSNFSVY